jgi:hypothetical protein
MPGWGTDVSRETWGENMERKWEEDYEAVEQMIDQMGLNYLLDVISDICIGKAEHIRTNYADDDLAEAWDEMAENVSHAAQDSRVN